jgi:hypothetical protein
MDFSIDYLNKNLDELEAKMKKIDDQIADPSISQNQIEREKLELERGNTMRAWNQQNRALGEIYSILKSKMNQSAPDN